MTPQELRDKLRHAFLAGYECGRLDERDEWQTCDGELPANVVAMEEHRTKRRSAAV